MNKSDSEAIADALAAVPERERGEVTRSISQVADRLNSLSVEVNGLMEELAPIMRTGGVEKNPGGGGPEAEAMTPLGGQLGIIEDGLKRLIGNMKDIRERLEL
jgi:hypothetical protein